MTQITQHEFSFLDASTGLLKTTINQSQRETIVDLSEDFEQPYWADGAADFVHDPGVALHEDLWPDPRAIGDGLGRAARVGGEEPARHLQGADHRRGRAELADDRLPVPAIAVLSGDRWRRC